MAEATNINASQDDRAVELQGSVNAARQNALVNAFFYQAGNLLLGNDYQQSPRPFGYGAPNVGINPITGEFFELGKAQGATAERGGSAEKKEDRSKWLMMAGLGVIVFLTLKKMG